MYVIGFLLVLGLISIFSSANQTHISYSGDKFLKVHTILREIQEVEICEIKDKPEELRTSVDYLIKGGDIMYDCYPIHSLQEEEEFKRIRDARGDTEFLNDSR